MLGNKFVSSLFFFLLVLVMATGCKFEDQFVPGSDEDPNAIPDGDSSIIDPGGDMDVDRETTPLFAVTEPDSWVTEALVEPLDIHLSWEYSPANSMTVQWQTSLEIIDIDAETWKEMKDRGETYLPDYEPKVWFVKADEEGVEENGENTVLPMADHYLQNGKGFTYLARLKNPETGNDEERVIAQWEVTILGLEPDTRYFYRAGTWDEITKDEDNETAEFVNPTLSPVYEFRTGLVKGDDTAFTFMLAGDSRGGYTGIRDNIDALHAYDTDFWLFNGDMNDTGTQGQWHEWFDAMAPLMKDTPLLPTLGNHEQLGKEELFFWQFALPKADSLSGELKEHAYSIVYGNAIFIMLDSTATFEVDFERRVREQVPWLEQTLDAANADPDIDWKIVMTHYPVYSACKTHGTTERLVTHWSPVFESKGVDLVYAGHDHNYERTHPVKNGETVPDGQGTVYLVAGAFYSPGYSAGTDWFTRVSLDGHNGNYVVGELNGKTLSLTAYDGSHNEIDSYTMTK